MSFITQLEELVDTSATFDQDKARYDTEWGSLRCSGRRIIVPSTSLFSNGSVVLRPTPWAMDQLAKKLGPSHFGTGSKKMLPADYFEPWDDDTYDYLLNKHFAKADKPVRVLSYQDSARAFLSDIYGEVENTLALQWAMDAFKANGNNPSGYKMLGHLVTPDAMYIKAMTYTRQTPDGPYGIGVFIRNGEIGNYQIECSAMIQRTRCLNSVIFSTDQSFKRFHKGSSSVLKTLFYAAIIDRIVESTTMIDKMMAAYEIALPNIEQVIAKLAKDQGWQDEFALQVALGTATTLVPASVGGLVQGVAAAAQGIENPEAQVRMEEFAGKLLADPDSLFGRAAMAYQEVER